MRMYLRLSAPLHEASCNNIHSVFLNRERKTILQLSDSNLCIGSFVKTPRMDRECCDRNYLWLMSQWMLQLMLPLLPLSVKGSTNVHPLCFRTHKPALLTSLNQWCWCSGASA